MNPKTDFDIYDLNFNFIGAMIPGFTEAAVKNSAIEANTFSNELLTKEKLKILLEAVKLDLMVNYVNAYRRLCKSQKVQAGVKLDQAEATKIRDDLKTIGNDKLLKNCKHICQVCYPKPHTEKETSSH